MKKLLILILFSCESYNQEYVDPTLQPYLDMFHIEAQRLGVKLPDKSVLMYFERMEGRNGYCNWNKKSMQVRIDPDMFYDWSEYSHTVEATVFHELAHGYLHRGHIENTTLIEPSLMAVPHNGRSTWVDGTMREYYLKELFGII